MKRKSEAKIDRQFQMLITAKQMSVRCGIGENTLRKLMEDGEIEYLQIGSRRLLCDAAIWDYYERKKTPAKLLRTEFADAPQPISA